MHRESERDFCRAPDYAEAIIRTIRDPLVILTADLRVHTANRAFYETFKVAPAESEGRFIYELVNRQWDNPTLRRLLEEVLPRNSTFDDFEVTHESGASGHRTMLLNARTLNDTADQPARILLGIQDITEVPRLQGEQPQLLVRGRADREEAKILGEIARAVASELDLQKLVQIVTDASTQLTDARFGAFFYNVTDDEGESYLLYTVSGAPREAFEKFGLPRNTALFEPTFRGQGVVRIADVLADPRYGKSPPHRGMPTGHLPVRSYLAVPVVSRSGEVLGGLFFGHPEPGVFTERAERMSVAIAAQAAVAVDNARLFGEAQKEIARRQQSEEALRASEERFRVLFDSVPVGVFSCNSEGIVQDYNRRAVEMWGREPKRGDPSERYCGSLKLYRPDGSYLPHADSPLAQVLRTGVTVKDVDVVIERPNGSRVDAVVTFSPLKSDRGEVTGAITAFYDITERKCIEKARIDQQAVLQLIAEDAPLAEVLEAVLGTVERQSRIGMLSSILLVEADGRHLRHAAGQSLPLGYTQAIDGIEIGPAMGSCGTAAHTKAPVYVSDISDDPLWVDFRDLALSYGLRACWSTPIFSRAGEVLGTFAMYYPRACEPHQDDLKLIESVTRIAAIAIERKRAEEELRYSEAQRAAIISHAPVGMYLVDARMRILSVNPKARPVFGAVENLIGRDLAEVIHILWPKAVADDVVERFRQTLNSGESYYRPGFAEDRIDRDAREYYDWEIHQVALPDGQYGVVCYFIDISAHVLAEQKIREGGERLRFMAESMPQKIFTARPNGEIDYFNPQWSQFTGLTFEEISDWGWTQFIHPDDVAENVRVWRRSLDTGEPFSFEHRFRRSDGEYRWHISRALPMRDEAGRVLMWVGSNTDIHEQKQTADALRKLAADLSEANRRKNEFLAMLAHELRNPLAPIRSAIEITRLTRTDEQAFRSACDMLERQVAQMVRLVDDLLDVSRISRGRIELRKEQVELTSIMGHVVETARLLADRLNHELVITLPPHPMHMYADPARLAQVVGNLLHNACKFTPEGGRIALTVEQDDENALIRVRDTGIGIAAGALPYIFEMFTQVDTSLERTQSGLGIGLTVVKNLVELHGGTVEAYSAGHSYGSEFTVRLPILAEPPPPLGPQSAVTEAATTTHRILIVDDNRDAAIALAMLLKFDGNETHIAYDGMAAVEAAATLRPDVVLLDLGLPRLNGYEVARKIRAQTWGQNVMLVAVTGWGQEEDRLKSRDAGFNAHFVKPVDAAALTKLLTESRPAT